MPNPDAITRGYQNAKERLSLNTARALNSLWNGLPNYREANIDRFVEVATPVMRGAQRRQAQLTAAYHRQVGAVRGNDVPMALLPADVIANPRDGVDVTSVLRRPANDVYKALANDKTMTEAVTAGAQRLNNIARTNLQLVSTKQSDWSLQAGGYRYYRRVLTGRENCALCVIASTQRYTVGDLLPIHPACDCTVDSVKADFDPGQVIDPDTLERTHGMVEEINGIAARDGRSVDYRELLITTGNNEIGPVIDWRKRFDPEALRLADQIMGGATQAEPGLTSFFQRLAQNNEAEMVGLDFRLKSRDSLYRKIRDEALEQGIPVSQVRISDAVRYTMQIPDSRYASTVTDVITQLRSEGYQLRVKNYWKPGAEYKGVNVAGIAPDGTRFELQFHTPVGYDVKEGSSHKWYEIARSKTATPEEVRVARAVMAELWDDVPTPPNLSSIPK